MDMIVTMRDGSVEVYVSNQTLIELAIDGDLDEQFIVFTDDTGAQTALPADDIARIECITVEGTEDGLSD